MATVQNYIKSSLKIVVAQICHNMGWHAIQTTPLDLLVDILHRYLEELGKTSHRYSEQFGRTEPNLDDLGLAFKDVGILLGELEDFVNNVEPVPFVQDTPKIPVAKPSNLQFSKPGIRELLTRPEWIDEHLPRINPEADDEEVEVSPTTYMDCFNRKNGESNLEAVDGGSHGLRRPLEISTNGVPFKRPRLFADDEGCPMRDGISVSLTLTGDIAVEGRHPAARAPKFYDEIRSSSSSHSPEPSTVEGTDGWKEGKKDLKKTDKLKLKSKKDKGKIVKKKNGKKEKVKNSSKKNKDKNKDGKKLKLLGESILSNVERGPDGKFKKLKISKSKPLILKAKKGTDKSNKLKLKRKLQLLEPLPLFTPSVKFTKTSKANKSSKMATKTPKIEKQPSPLAQLATFLSMADNRDQQTDANLSPEMGPPIKNEISEVFSGEDSPERLIIDDNPALAENNDKESRLASFNDSINTVILKGLEETAKVREESSRSYNETIEDVIRQSAIEPLPVKTEPRDVYDFTDDEMSPPATPVTPEIIITSPPKKKARNDTGEMGKKVRDKIKEKIKMKSKEPKMKIKTPFAKFKNEEMDYSKMVDTPSPRVDTPEPDNGVSFQAPYPPMLHLPYFNQISKVPPALLPYPTSIPSLPLPFQSHTPPNMPMPPVGFYVRNPRPESGNFRFSEPVPNPMLSPPVSAPITIEVKKPDVFTQAKVENLEEIVDKGKGSQFKKEKIEEDETEKTKSKRKKEKGKEKKKNADASGTEKSKSSKGNKEKVPKSKDKSKKTEKKKKEDKTKDDSSSTIPRITLKLGGNAAQSEGTKIVIKPLAPREIVQSSDSSSPTIDILSTTPKSHPKPQSKVNPVPLPVKAATATASAPTRTVITETIGTIIDEQGNKIWICPACTRPDDGSPMIGCDECDDWYHWVCVGIVVPPKEEENWFCSRCIVKKQGLQKKKKKKHRKDKNDV